MNPQLQQEIKALLIINGLDDTKEYPTLEKNIISLVEKYSDPEKSVSLLRPNLLKGKDAKACPLCDQTVKVYYRSITPAMAYCLIKVYRNTLLNHLSDHVNILTGLVNIPALFKDNHAVQSDFTKLKFWGLIEPGTDAEKAGMWRLSDKGRKFVENKLSVQKYAKVYNDTFKGFDGEMEDILMCLDGKYNYTHLMTAPADTI